MAVVLDLVRLFVGVSVLSFAAFTDWRWRRAPHLLWVLVTLAGLVLLAIEAALDASPWAAKWPYLLPVPILLLLAWESDRADLVAGGLAAVGGALVLWRWRVDPTSMTPQWPWLVGVLLFAGAVYALYWLGLIAGGADARALMSIAVLAPFPVLLIEGVPPLASPLPGAMAVLGDTLLVALVFPLAFFAWNLTHGALRFPHMLLGLRRAGRDVRRGHVWPMETVDEAGKRKSRFFASRMSAEEVDATFERLQALGDTPVWVTPKVPLMIPILVGFVMAFLLGDALTWLVTSTIAR